MDYKAAGVDIDAGNDVVDQVKRLARSTFTDGVLSDIGTFGGLFRPELGGMDEPVLVASADGVGTKLKVAFLARAHGTVGLDLVNHCVNDILVQGARPIFFLDYLATAHLAPDIVAAVVEGVAHGCKENGCALLGGETAEMPGFYEDGEYDLAGFVVGLVDRARIIDGRTIAPGDIIIGLPSTGLHTNGYSLARHVLFDQLGFDVDTEVQELGCTLGEELLRPHCSYLPTVGPAIESGLVKGIAHITGGGLTDNVPRALPSGCTAVIDREAWPVPPIFDLLRERGDVPIADMYRTFNMGVGLAIICGRADAPGVLATLISSGEVGAARIGEIRAGDPGVEYAKIDFSRPAL